MKLIIIAEIWQNFGKKAVLNYRKICDSWNMNYTNSITSCLPRACASL